MFGSTKRNPLAEPLYNKKFSLPTFTGGIGEDILIHEDSD